MGSTREQRANVPPSWSVKTVYDRGRTKRAHNIDGATVIAFLATAFVVGVIVGAIEAAVK